MKYKERSLAFFTANRYKHVMLILSRYMVKYVALTTLLIALVLTAIIWLTQSLRLLDLIINGGAPLSIFGGMLVLTMPKFLEVILPLSLALGIIYSLNKFSNDSELIVMQNIGASPARLASGLIALSLFFALVVFALAGWATPLANRKLDQLADIVKSEYSFGLLRPGIFNVVGNGVTIYIAERHSLKDLKGVFVHLSKPGEPPATITAQNGGLVVRGKKPYLIVFDGMRQQFNPQTGMVETLKFERYSVNLTSLSGAIGLKENNPSDLTLTDLFAAPQSANGSQAPSGFSAEFHNRMSKPLLTMALALLTIVPFLLSHYNRRGQSLRATATIIGIILVQSAYLAASAVAGKYMAGTLAVYLIPSFIIVVYAFRLLNYGSDDRVVGTITWLLGGKERLI